MSDEIQNPVEPVAAAEPATSAEVAPAEPVAPVAPLVAEVVPAIAPVAVAPAEPVIVPDAVIPASLDIPVHEMSLAQRLEAIIHAFEHVSITAARDLVHALHKDVSGA